MKAQTPERRLRRLKAIISPGGPIPMSRSAFYAAVKAGRIAAPVKLGKISAWRDEDIQKLIDHGIDLSKDGQR